MVYTYARVTKGKHGSEKVVKSMADSLFYDEIITICLEGFLELVISGYLEHINPWRNPSEYASVVMGYTCLLLALVMLPSVLIWVLIQDTETLYDSSFTERYGRAILDIKLHNRWTRSFYIV